MEHCPPRTRVTVLPDTEQTADVVELKLTSRPEVDMALIPNGAPPRTWFGIAGKLMVCVTCNTSKLLLTGAAAAKVALPAWFAVMLPVPAESSVTEKPDTAQPARVVLV